MAARRFRPRQCAGVSPPTTSHYLPAFPFPYYNRLSERDLADLKAFSTVCRRYPQLNRAGDRAPFAAARGAVVVVASTISRTLASRSDARTRCGIAAPTSLPRSAAAAIATRRAIGSGAPDPDRALAGVSRPRWPCRPNITPDPETGIGRWSVDDIVTLLTDGQKPDFDFVGGDMGEIVNNTARLDDVDRRAIAVYLKSLPPIGSPKKD